MTATVRELVHARVKTVLDGIGGGVKAFRNRTSIPNSNEMPLLILYDEHVHGCPPRRCLRRYSRPEGWAELCRGSR